MRGRPMSDYIEAIEAYVDVYKKRPIILDTFFTAVVNKAVECGMSEKDAEKVVAAPLMIHEMLGLVVESYELTAQVEKGSIAPGEGISRAKDIKKEMQECLRKLQQPL